MVDDRKIEDKMFLTNIYALNISLPDVGINLNDTTHGDEGRSADATYHEVCDYLNEDFPTRVLTVKLYPKDISKLVNYRKNVKEDKTTFRTRDKSLFNIEILANPIGSTGKSLLKPFMDGKFKAVMRENDKLRSYLTTQETKDRSERNVVNFIEITFYLFRAEELSFGLSGNLNFLYRKDTLTEVFGHLFTTANPTTKLVVSPFDYTTDLVPVLKNFLIPTMSFREALRLLEDEFGFYKTPILSFLENNVFYFLNTQNKLNVTVSSLSNTIRLNTIKDPAGISPKVFTRSKKSKEMLININKEDMSIFTDSESIVRNPPIYINASGGITATYDSSARDVDTVRKITDTPNLTKHSNTSYEYITLQIKDISSIEINPLTSIEYFDDIGVPKKYRVCRKEIRIRSNYYLISEVSGFTLINDNN